MHLYNLKKFSLSPHPPSQNIEELYLVLFIHTSCTTQPYKASKDTYIYQIVYKCDTIIWTYHERNRERDPHLQHLITCYTAKKFSIVGKKAARPSKCRLKKIGIVIHSHQSRMRIARIKKTNTNDLNYNLH